MATNHTRIPLSGSTNGAPIPITSTTVGTLGQTIHTASGTANVVDTVELFASNEDTVVRTLTLQIGGATDFTNTEKFTLPAAGAAGDGRAFLGSFTIQSSVVIAAIASSASKIKVSGGVTRVTNV